MEKETKRYRMRPKTYLGLSPEEVLASGISTGEETLEELTLVQSQGFGYQMYATIRDMPENELFKIPIHERNESLFESRKDAIKLIKSQPDDKLLLYAVKNIRVVDRNVLNVNEEESTDNVIEELKKFNV